MKRIFENYEHFQKWYKYRKLSVSNNIIFAGTEYAGEYEVNKKNLSVIVRLNKKHIPDKEILENKWQEL